jgi:hypothetical protein
VRQGWRSAGDPRDRGLFASRRRSPDSLAGWGANSVRAGLATVSVVPHVKMLVKRVCVPHVKMLVKRVCVPHVFLLAWETDASPGFCRPPG